MSLTNHSSKNSSEMARTKVPTKSHPHIGWMSTVEEGEEVPPNEQKPAIWQWISELHFSEPSDAQDWWRTAGYILAVLLHQAQYTTESQYRNLVFFALLVVRELGPSPSRVLSQPRWKSFMTDDHMPIEFSWEWGLGQNRPSIRYGIEPVGPYAGTSYDPFNQHVGPQLARRLGKALPKSDLEWFEHFSNEFLVFDGSDGRCNENHESRFFAAFDLHEKDITFKAYFFPGFKAAKIGRSKMDCISSAFDRLPGKPFGENHAFDLLRKYMQCPTQNGSMEVEMLAFDCVIPAMSRVKIYARSRFTSFDSVKSIMTLGGRLNSLGTTKGVEELQVLWNLLFGADRSSSEELQQVGHRTAGIIYYFEIKPGKPFPIPKLYIPVRHYVKTDFEIIEALGMYLQRHDKDDQSMIQYVQAMKTIL